MLEMMVIISSIIPTIFVTYLCRISYRRKETEKLIGSIISFLIYALLIIAFDKVFIQLMITAFYALITYFLFVKEIKKIEKEHNDAVLDRMEASYQKYAVKPKRRKV
jgi:predicted membrane protein